MTAAADLLGPDAGLLPAADAAPLLAEYLGCEVTRCPGRPGRVEARGLPGAHVLIGRPAEVAAWGREALMREWLAVLGSQKAPPPAVSPVGRGRARPLVQAVADEVLGMIADGTLKPGDPSPSADSLREKTGVGRAYCLAALARLEADGVLVRVNKLRRRVAGPGEGNG